MSLTEEVKELYDNGYSRKEISQILNQTEGKIRWIIEKNKLTKGLKENKKHKKVIDMYLNGYSQKEIAEEVNLKTNTISWILTKNNIPKQKERKYHVNDHYFNSIDNQNKAYWLGFLYADGAIHPTKNAIGMRLSIRDIEQVKSFLNELDSDYPIYTGTQDSYGTQTEYCDVQIYSSQLKNDLISLGCTPKKSKILKFPSEDIVPKSLIFHFIRGYMDGDGSISRKKDNNFMIAFEGTLSMLEGIKESFNKTNKITKAKKGHVHSYYIGGNVQLLNILSLIYKDAELFLPRKYEKYLELIQYTNRGENNVINM